MDSSVRRSSSETFGSDSGFKSFLSGSGYRVWRFRVWSLGLKFRVQGLSPFRFPCGVTPSHFILYFGDYIRNDPVRSELA